MPARAAPNKAIAAPLSGTLATKAFSDPVPDGPAKRPTIPEVPPEPPPLEFVVVEELLELELFEFELFELELFEPALFEPEFDEEPAPPVAPLLPGVTNAGLVEPENRLGTLGWLGLAGTELLRNGPGAPPPAKFEEAEFPPA